MKVDRLKLIAALEIVVPGASTSTQISGCDRVTAFNGHLYTFSDTIAIRTKFKFPEELEVSVSIYDLLTTLKRYTVPEVSIELKDAVLILKGGKAKASLKTFPVMKNSVLYLAPPPMIDLPSDYYDAFVSCLIPGNKTTFAGILFDGFSAMSTDRNRINFVEFSKDSPRFWINDSGVKVIIKAGNIFTSYGVSMSHLWVMDGTTVMTFRRLNDEQYQTDLIRTYYGMCKIEEVPNFDIPVGLLEAANRAAPFTATEENLHPIEITISPEGIEVKTHSGSDAYEELVEFDDPLDVEPVTLKVDYTQFLYGLKKSTKMGVKHIQRETHEYLMLVLYGERSTLMLNTLK